MTAVNINAPQAKADLDYKYRCLADSLVTKAEEGVFDTYAQLRDTIADAQRSYDGEVSALFDGERDLSIHDDLLLLDTEAEKAEAAGTPLREWAGQFICKEWLGK